MVHASSPPSDPSSKSTGFSLSLSLTLAEMAAAKLVVLPCWAPPLPAAFPARRKLECGRRRVRKGSVVSQVGVGDVVYSVAEGSGVGYSPLSYYTSLGLFVISVPGLWSLIKRSVKSKVVQKTFVKEGQKPNQVAGEILSFFTRNNFTVSDRGETISFEGMMVPSRGQAALLTFCTCISLGSVALVLSIAVPQGGNNWFWIMVLSPLAGIYYWQRASRKEEIQVKIMVGEDGSLSEIIVRGDDQQVEQMRKDLQLSEKGMIYVKGIFET